MTTRTRRWLVHLSKPNHRQTYKLIAPDAPNAIFLAKELMGGDPVVIACQQEVEWDD